MDCDVAGNHVNSFNYLIDGGLESAIQDVIPERFRINESDNVEIWLEDPVIGYPSVGGELSGTRGQCAETKLYPAECRQRGLTYTAHVRAKVRCRLNGMDLVPVERSIGEIPIMLRSKRCNLYGLSEAELVRRGEEPKEFGGYYIVNGGEKVIRCLVGMRRNYPVALIRDRFRTRGKLYTQFAVTMRCVKGDHTANTMTLHYMENGNIMINFFYRAEIFYVPLMYLLKAFLDENDRKIFDYLMLGREKDDFWKGCVINMFHMAQDAGILGSKDVQERLGAEFRVAMGDRIPPWFSDENAGKFLLSNCVLIHLDDAKEKFHFLVYSAQKLMALVRGKCMEDSPDNPQFQEATLSGHIILLLAKDKIESVLFGIRRSIEIAAKRKNFNFDSQSFSGLVNKTSSFGALTQGLQFFLGTGNLVAKSALGLGQKTGFTVVAERINQLRFISHFRAIHRGASFMDMRTTDVRKLRPEAWGFICPVHTPDGGPCGLLNHFTAACIVDATGTNVDEMLTILEEEGFVSIDDIGVQSAIKLQDYPVFFNGRFKGFIAEAMAIAAERRLRREKVRNAKFKLVEICLILASSDPQRIKTQYPGLFIFSEAGRMMRPVRNMQECAVEYIGTYEQIYLSICLDKSEFEPGVTFHQEIAPNTLFSFAGNLIPYPDHNQSPRNVYQCQMGKQTMGIPVHAWQYRADNKMYRIQTPQSPMVKPEAYDKYDMDTYPLGTNAIVAVISYTGYDMEDAMVLNKSSYERGFAHGTVYKSEKVDLRPNAKSRRAAKSAEYFAVDPNQVRYLQYMDSDGLPIPNRFYQEGDPYYSLYNKDTGSYKVKIYKSVEPAYLEEVKLLGSDGGSSDMTEEKNNALFVWRIRRNPIIGDKFASRHGQKGINSFFYPIIDLPFTESGMVPDIIFNPHGFPSRMTIGMMIESMAGKAAASHGWEQDATPFVFDEKQTAIDHFGQLLIKAGYNYYGNEVMYSGLDGRELKAEIFFGIVYYQRLRHMIADKYQVRATGPIDALTHQPVKGRKRAGGIRFGEMERDALIAHGTSGLLQDRLLNCSDKDNSMLCKDCGTLLSVSQEMRETGRSFFPQSAPRRRRKSSEMAEKEGEVAIEDTSVLNQCFLCGKTDSIEMVTVPYVLKYLVMELACMNIKTVVTLK